MKKLLMLVLSLALTGALAQAQTSDKDKDNDAKKSAQTKDQDRDKDRDKDKDKDRDRDKAQTAQAGGMDEHSERAVHITSGPAVANLTGSSATLNWATNTAGANDVHYNCGWPKDKIAYHRGGGTEHSVTLTGLKPNSTCTWKIMTHDGELRKEGTFQTPAQ
jgi:Ni/Co efflux regulator RcnB